MDCLCPTAVESWQIVFLIVKILAIKEAHEIMTVEVAGFSGALALC